MYKSHLAKDSRKSPREEVSWLTVLNGPALPPADALIVNLSPTGCMMRTDAILTPGERVTLALPIVSHTEARVMWALGGRIGVEFAIPVPLHSYLPMLNEMQRDDR